MLCQKFDVSAKEVSSGAEVAVYIQEHSEALLIDKRPLIIVCPGGAYRFTSDREAEVIALQFLSMGYHAAVLRYSVAPVRFPAALMELANSMLLFHEHAEEWHIDTEKLIVAGFSAGGHLAASLGIFWNSDFLYKKVGLDSSQKELLRPAGMILGYPVISSGEYAHRNSFDNLLGEQKELLELVSLEKQVTKDVPQTFLWHTFEDDAVPVENSIMFVNELRKNQVSVEFHLFPKGGHGLALANRISQGKLGNTIQNQCRIWITLAQNWLETL